MACILDMCVNWLFEQYVHLSCIDFNSISAIDRWLTPLPIAAIFSLASLVGAYNLYIFLMSTKKTYILGLHFFVEKN